MHERRKNMKWIKSICFCHICWNYNTMLKTETEGIKMNGVNCTLEKEMNKKTMGQMNDLKQFKLKLNSIKWKY